LIEVRKKNTHKQEQQWFENVLNLRPFESMVAIVFQSVFYLKIHQNNFFYFLKIIFHTSALKWSENIKKILIWSKVKDKKI